MWDYIVVGAGSAGCVVVNRLSEQEDKKVLLLEAGPNDRSWALKIPGGAFICDTRRFDWGYRSAPDPTRNDKSDHWVRGRVLGGSSSINGMNYVRGAASDYDRWAEMGNSGWAARDVMPLFQSLECCEERSCAQFDETRGRDGSLHIRTVQHHHPATQAFIDAAVSVGHRFNPDYNGASQEGVGYTQLTQRRGRRCSAADAFLAPIVARENLKVIVNAQVHKVLIKQRRAHGVLYERNGVLQEALAKQVILCAGAIATPQLLMLSGIGDAEALSAHGIEVLVNRKSVGENLLEHPVLTLVYRMNAPTYNFTGGLRQKIQILAQYLFKGEGPVASVFEGMGFLKTSAAQPQPDIQLHFSPLGLDFQNSQGKAVQMLPYPSVTVWLNKSHPLSRGRVRLAGGDPQQPPLIEPRLLDREEDLETLVRGVETVRRVMAAEPMAEWVREEVRPGNANMSANAIRSYIRNNTSLAYHPAGTCRMGADEDAVVTPELQVRGIEKLWIADASVMPDLVSGNTNAVCMMIGEKLSRALGHVAA